MRKHTKRAQKEIREKEKIRNNWGKPAMGQTFDLNTLAINPGSGSDAQTLAGTTVELPDDVQPTAAAADEKHVPNRAFSAVTDTIAAHTGELSPVISVTLSTKD